jgi:nucleoside-diphosphate-sugar epimerase
MEAGRSRGGAALIGYTGFVGGTLLRSGRFDRLFNSSNVEDMAGESFDLVVCAGVSAVKWLANKDPDSDKAGIARLTDALESVEAREFILVSTIDVYPDPSAGADEEAEIDPAANHPYGAHRYRLEEWIKSRFPLVRIVRLPALFGEGLRKNALYDLLNSNATESINPAGEFQWYPTRRLSDDIERMREADLKLVNLFGAPLAMREAIDSFFPEARTGPAREPAPRYDLRTRHAETFGGAGGYVLDRTLTLGEMARFVAAERRRQRTGD